MARKAKMLALDTESDRFRDGDGKRDISNTRYTLLTTCSPDATSLDDVNCHFDDENAWFPFLASFDADDCDYDIEWFNGGYEHGAMWDALMEKGYRFVSPREFPPGTKRSEMVKRLRSIGHAVLLNMDKRAGFLEALITSPTETARAHRGTKEASRLMVIRDAARIGGGKHTMAETADAIRLVHPDWWAEGMDTKEHLTDDDYNNGWYFDRMGYDRFLHYSKQDAYSQAMIFRHYAETGQSKGMSRSGNSWRMAIDLCEGGDNSYFNRKGFSKRFPPLSVESQLLYQEGLLGGYVYGQRGDLRGITATKGDYKSSYPAGYWFYNLPFGKEYRILPGHPDYERAMKDRGLCRFVSCEFDFSLKSDIHQPCINAYECLDDDGEPWSKGLNRKMKDGHRRMMLTPEPYLEAVKRHYDVSNLMIYEVRCFKGDQGRHYYRPAIRSFFFDKESNVKNGVFYNEAKANMTGGMHGKNIQGIDRQYRDYEADGSDGDFKWSRKMLMKELKESPYPFYLGMWVMMCRRGELLNDIAEANDKGIRNLMADTDSMILQCDTERFREIYGKKVLDKELSGLLKHLDRDRLEDWEQDWFISKVLGKIDIEMEDIRRFKCWGLKRYYCEGGDGKTVSTAFAGMGDRGWFRGVKYEKGLQAAVLSGTDIDGELVWEQNTMVAVPGKPHTKTIDRETRHAVAENIWFDDDLKELLAHQKRVRKLTQEEGYLQAKGAAMYRALDETKATEDELAELGDSGYKTDKNDRKHKNDIDKHTWQRSSKHQHDEYIQRKLDEWRMSEDGH